MIKIYIYICIMKDLIKKACEIVVSKYDSYDKIPEQYKYFYREYISKDLGKRKIRDWQSDDSDSE
jgi:hypothetical protein